MIAILLALQSVASPDVPHSGLHPASVDSFAVVHRLPDVVAAYEGAPVLRFLSDPAVLGLIAGLTGMPLEPEQLEPAALLETLAASAASNPEMPWWPMAEPALRDLRSVSVSMTLGGDLDRLTAEVMHTLFVSQEIEGFEQALLGALAERPRPVETDEAEAASPSVPSDTELAAIVEAVRAEDPSFATDPWGNAYDVQFTTVDADTELAPRIDVRVRSFGSDGAPGGEGEARDRVGGASDFQTLLDMLGVQLTLEFGSSATPAGLMGMLQGALGEGGDDMPVEITSYASDRLNGVDVQAVADGSDDGVDVSGWVATHGDHLSIGFGRGDLAGFEALLGGASATLASSREFVDGIRALPDRIGERIATPPAPAAPAAPGEEAAPEAPTAPDHPTAVVLSTRYDRWTESALFDAMFDALLASEELDAMTSDVKADEEQALELARGLFAAWTADRRPRFARQSLVDGRFHSDSLRPGSSVPSALFPTGPLGRRDLELLTTDAAIVHAGQIDLGAAYDALLQRTAEGQGTEPAQVHADVVALLGVDPREELFPTLGQSFAFGLEPIRGIGAPRVAVHIGTNDPERTAAALATMAESLAASYPAEFEARTRPYRKMPLIRLALKGIDLGVPISIEPTAGIVGDRLIIGLSGAQMKKQLKRLAAEEFEAHALLDPTNGYLSDDTTSVTYVDWASFLGAAYDAGRTMASFAGPDAFELPISLDQLPPGSIFSSHFGPHVWNTRDSAAGTRVETSASLGPEFALGLAAAGSALGVSGVGEEMVMGLEQGGPERRVAEVAPLDAGREKSGSAGGGLESGETADAARARTDRALGDVRIALQIHFLETEGAYPTDLAVLSQPTPNFPQGCLDGAPLPTDGWGRALRYDRTETGYRLWSVGADGVDEFGAGDDVLVAKD